MGKPLECVIGQLPFLRELLTEVFARDETFRELCAEYEVCLEALARFEAEEPVNQPLRNEYAVLRMRLEGEMLRYLDPRTTSGQG